MDKNHYMINMQKVLHMAAILHAKGYEKLHVIPSLSPSGLSWRCVFITMDTEPVIVSNWIFQQFDINAVSEIDVLELVNRFESQYFNFLRSCIGSDSRYVVWYRQMLAELEEEELPYAFSDYFSPRDHWMTSRDKRIMTLPDEKQFLDIFLNGKKTPDFGPQSPSDNPFTAKARKLQSLWRVQNGLEMGIGPNKNSTDKYGQPTFYGNMINYGESNGRNFFYPETFAYAKWRVNTKMKDETIDEYRLFNNLMSSMPMAFNLFHPLMMLHAQNPAAVDKMMQNAFPKLPIYKIKEIGLEFIPTPIELYTNDKSAMDAFILFWDKDGGEHIIAIETKYTDSLGTNTASGKGVLGKQIQMLKVLDLFTEICIQKLESKEIQLSQIYRNFLLTEKYRQVQNLKNSYSIILALEKHPTTDKEIISLKEFLKKEHKEFKLNKFSLELFIKKLKENCPFEYMGWLDWFEDRYLNFEKLNENL